MSARVGATLQVHLTAAVDVGHAILHLEDNRSVNVVVVIVVPHRFHGVEVDTQYVAMVVTNEAIVLVHCHARLHSSAIVTLDHIAQSAVHLELAVAQALIFIQRAILCRIEQELPCHYRR